MEPTSAFHVDKGNGAHSPTLPFRLSYLHPCNDFFDPLCVFFLECLPIRQDEPTSPCMWPCE
jgi:hypothetical protein